MYFKQKICNKLIIIYSSLLFTTPSYLLIRFSIPGDRNLSVWMQRIHPAMSSILRHHWKIDLAKHTKLVERDANLKARNLLSMEDVTAPPIRVLELRILVILAKWGGVLPCCRRTPFRRFSLFCWIASLSRRSCWT